MFISTGYLTIISIYLNFLTSLLLSVKNPCCNAILLPLGLGNIPLYDDTIKLCLYCTKKISAKPVKVFIFDPK